MYIIYLHRIKLNNVYLRGLIYFINNFLKKVTNLKEILTYI